jgi:hypothetical protein
MRTFYFVGGPTPGHRDEFFGRLVRCPGNIDRNGGFR